jgi:amino acid transporter
VLGYASGGTALLAVVAAGIRLWMTRAMNDRVALIVALTYMAVIVLVVAADAFLIGEAIAYVVHSGTATALGAVLLLLAGATWLNLRGIRLTGAVERIATTTVVILTVVVAVAALVRPAVADAAGAAVGTVSPVQAVVVAVFVYVGFEWVTTNAEEVTRPSIIPRAMLVAIGVLAVSQGLFVLAMARGLDGDGLASAYPQILVAQHALGRIGVALMLAVTALTAVNTFNGGFVTLSRFVYAIAREGKLPPSFARLNTHAVPVVPVVLLGAVSIVVAVAVTATRSFAMMVSVGAALEAAIYAIAAFVVFRLRRRMPDAARPNRLPGGRPAALALTVLFGLLALVASVSVGPAITPAPLLVIAIAAVATTAYVVTYVPRLERRAEAELAARRAARARARSSSRRRHHVPDAPGEERDAGADEGPAR